MNNENILIIESDCEIIRPIFIKNHNIKINDLEIPKNQKSKSHKIKCNNFSFNEEKKTDLIGLIENMNKSNQLIRGFKEEDEIDKEYVLDLEKRKAKYSIIEILRILSQPIINEYSKSRNILKKDISNIYEIYENLFNEKEFKDENNLNINNENILFFNNIKETKGINKKILPKIKDNKKI